MIILFNVDQINLMVLANGVKVRHLPYWFTFVGEYFCKSSQKQACSLN